MLLDTVDWIAVAFGCICSGGALMCWRNAKSSKRLQQRLQLDLQKAHCKTAEAQRLLQEMIDSPPVPTHEQVVSHLSILCERMVQRVLELDGARVSSAEPLRLATEESEQSRVMERKKRFEKYRDILFQANIEISLHIDRLLESHSAARTLLDALEAGYLCLSVGNSSCVGIRAVIDALYREESPDDTWRKAVGGINKDFNNVLRIRDQRRELDRLDRERDRVAAISAFNKFKLPPITPMEKFRALAPRGQRDNFDK